MTHDYFDELIIVILYKNCWYYAFQQTISALISHNLAFFLLTYCAWCGDIWEIQFVIYIQFVSLHLLQKYLLNKSFLTLLLIYINIVAFWHLPFLYWTENNVLFIVFLYNGTMSIWSRFVPSKNFFLQATAAGKWLPHYKNFTLLINRL